MKRRFEVVENLEFKKGHIVIMSDPEKKIEVKDVSFAVRKEVYV